LKQHDFGILCAAPERLCCLHAGLPRPVQRFSTPKNGGINMRTLTDLELRHVSGGRSKNQGGGPGNSGPGDKNGKNEKGHGGQPTG
jgi:hypothetical protein